MCIIRFIQLTKSLQYSWWCGYWLHSSSMPFFTQWVFRWYLKYEWDAHDKDYSIHCNLFITPIKKNKQVMLLLPTKILQIRWNHPFAYIFILVHVHFYSFTNTPMVTLYGSMTPNGSMGSLARSNLVIKCLPLCKVGNLLYLRLPRRLAGLSIVIVLLSVGGCSCTYRSNI